VLTSHSVWKNTTRLAWLLRHCSRPAFQRTQWTTVSRHTATALERAGLPNVSVLPNGIDVAAWNIERRNSPELRVTSVMRMNIKKRPQDLVRAIPVICRKLGPGLPVRFTLVGDGPYRRQVERLAERLGVGDKVEFAGRLSREEIKKVFEQTDLFVLPTVLEAFGIAVLEARCAGLPAVVIGSSGAADLVEDGIQGRLAADRHEMATIIAELLGDPAARRRMSQNARQGVEQFDWSRVVPLHLDAYRRAMGKAECAALRQPIDASS
jgi:glycosyltransferase involved in cell wall biosynthesis